MSTSLPSPKMKSRIMLVKHHVTYRKESQETPCAGHCSRDQNVNHYVFFCLLKCVTYRKIFDSFPTKKSVQDVWLVHGKLKPHGKVEDKSLGG